MGRAGTGPVLEFRKCTNEWVESVFSKSGDTVGGTMSRSWFSWSLLTRRYRLVFVAEPGCVRMPAVMGVVWADTYCRWSLNILTSSRYGYCNMFI
jgi:hypothetical protein